MRKIKQGQTKWQVVHYKPYSLEDQGDYWVTCVYSCYITKVKHGLVHYTSGGVPYTCSVYYWTRHMNNTFRKAYRKAQEDHYKLYYN